MSERKAANAADALVSSVKNIVRDAALHHQQEENTSLGKSNHSLEQNNRTLRSKIASLEQEVLEMRVL